MEETPAPEQLQPEQPSQNLGSEIVTGVYKYEGWKYKVGSVIYFVIGSICFLLGILLLWILHKIPFLGLTFIVFGGILIFSGWFYWKRSKPLTKGKLF
jgi:hypothetical protein